MKKIPLLLAASILLSFASCNNDRTATDTAASLPFFNEPDWTPEWISHTDPAFKNIHRIPAFSFTDQNGKQVTQNDISGKICIVNFFFIRCRNICPRMTANMHRLRDIQLQDPDLLFISHSVDPDNDSVPVLHQYAADNNIDAAGWRLLTGDKKEIYRLARKEYFAGDSVGYYLAGDEFLHTENFILLEPERRIRGVYNGTLRTEIDRIREDIQMLKKEIQ